MTPAWASTAIWWSVYPLGACGAPIREPDSAHEHHRLRHIEGWLDHVVALGCNGLALGPIWDSATHGYDIRDHVAIDPRLGTLADFDHLIAACRSRGIRVLLDGVFNHVSADHRDVISYLADGTPNHLFKSDSARVDGLSRFEGHDSLVELDHARESVIAYAAEAMNYWLDRGADGWRLDAAYRVAPAQWAAILSRVRTSHPDALILGEVLHGDYGKFAEAAGFDSVTQYELWKATWSCLKDRNPHELAWALKRHEVIRAHQIPWTFVGNHDVTRIATQIGAAAARVAFAIIATVAGMPAVYYGDEFGFTGLKKDEPGGDDAIRPSLVDGSDHAADEETLRMTQLTIRLRRMKPWLANARTQVLYCDHHRLVWHSASDDGDWIRAELTIQSDMSSLRVVDATGEVLRVGL
jgi:glycosidase